MNDIERLREAFNEWRKRGNTAEEDAFSNAVLQLGESNSSVVAAYAKVFYAGAMAERKANEDKAAIKSTEEASTKAKQEDEPNLQDRLAQLEDRFAMIEDWAAKRFSRMEEALTTLNQAHTAAQQLHEKDIKHLQEDFTRALGHITTNDARYQGHFRGLHDHIDTTKSGLEQLAKRISDLSAACYNFDQWTRSQILELQTRTQHSQEGKTTSNSLEGNEIQQTAPAGYDVVLTSLSREERKTICTLLYCYPRTRVLYDGANVTYRGLNLEEAAQHNWTLMTKSYQPTKKEESPYSGEEVWDLSLKNPAQKNPPNCGTYGQSEI